MKKQEKSCTSSAGETVSWTFSEKSKLSISQYFIQFVFIVYQVEGYRNILKIYWN